MLAFSSITTVTTIISKGLEFHLSFPNNSGWIVFFASSYILSKPSYINKGCSNTEEYFVGSSCDWRRVLLGGIWSSKVKGCDNHCISLYLAVCKADNVERQSTFNMFNFSCGEPKPNQCVRRGVFHAVFKEPSDHHRWWWHDAADYLAGYRSSGLKQE